MSDEGYNTYLFEYRFDDAEWGLEITARSPQEAKERIKALTWARYKGEIKATVRLPTFRPFRKIFYWLRPARETE